MRRDMDLEIGQGVEVVKLPPVLPVRCQRGLYITAMESMRTRLQRQIAWRKVTTVIGRLIEGQVSTVMVTRALWNHAAIAHRDVGARLYRDHVLSVLVALDIPAS